ncbi:aminodeoxychorismate/anthranilate synthase component II [Bacillus spongiae]|uniref:Aminodeoxychorismate/anthranilate synthase component II n=1 Tax=Bacillus spongiae TaxID=2683610 RepID=A0ABU8HKE0_9BACI
MILMIDNYDSFTYNLVQYLGELGEEIIVMRNDEVTINEIRTINPDYLMISPGPCTPNEAGISLEAIRAFSGEIPIFGVCLGQQSIAQTFGGKVIKAERLMHGKTSNVYHNQSGVFQGLKNPLVSTRYHSLIVEKETLPSCFDITGWTEEGEIMGIKHKEFPVEGVQFHPESVMTESGKCLLKNFLEQNRLYSKRKAAVKGS